MTEAPTVSGVCIAVLMVFVVFMVLMDRLSPGSSMDVEDAATITTVDG